MRGASRPSSEQPLVELSVETVPGGAVASLPVRKHPIGRSTDVFAGERSRSRASPAATRVSDDLTEGAEISLALRVSPDAPLRERPSLPRLLAIRFLQSAGRQPQNLAVSHSEIRVQGVAIRDLASLR